MARKLDWSRAKRRPIDLEADEKRRLKARAYAYPRADGGALNSQPKRHAPAVPATRPAPPTQPYQRSASTTVTLADIERAERTWLIPPETWQ